MYMRLGQIVFEPQPITGLSEEFGYDFPEHAVIEGKPLLQFIGDQLDVTTLSIRLHFSFCDPATAWAQIKAVADSHAAQNLVAADGTTYGLRVITRLSKTLVQTADNGRPLIIDGQLTLKEFVDADPLGSKQAAQKKSAPGLQGKGPIGKSLAEMGAERRKAVLAGGIIKADAGQTAVDSQRISSLAGQLPADADNSGGRLQALASSIRASAAPMMQSAQGLAAGVQGAAGQLQGYAGTISGLSSNITRITSGLPYPASIIGNRVAALNSRIAGRANSALTLAALTQGGAVEAGTRAQMISRMLPGAR